MKTNETSLYQEIMELTCDCFRVALKLEQYHDKLTEEQSDLVYGHTDGLIQKYHRQRLEGECSLQATIDYDTVQAEGALLSDLACMTGWLSQFANNA